MTRPTTARESGLMSCQHCGMLSGPEFADAQPKCPQCGTGLAFRKRESLTRTWALVLAALIFYVPANLLPVTRTTALGETSGQTIMDGVIYFVHHGDWPIGLVIFSASIMVPTIKITSLIFLLICAHRKTEWRPEDRSRLYNFTEFIGRWSMIDVFVISILVALVQLGALASIAAGVGAIFFAGVVILTMFAAESFDPRLIWDPVPLEA